MPKKSRNCVVVAGMHRSGTSALTRVLNIVGCDLPKNLLGINETNETGHWEPLPIVELNHALLDSAGSSWDDCTPCTPGWFQSPRAEEYREKCIAAYDAEFGESKLSVIKDPRFCRLMPIWLDVFDAQNIEPLIILPIRNPLAVAASLTTRDFSDPFYNKLLWLRHILDGEAGSRGRRRFFCGFDDLLDSWSILLNKAEEILKIKWPRLSPKASEEIDQYLASRHRHHFIPASRLLEDPAQSPWLRKTYQIMLDWIKNGENPADYATLDSIREAFDLSCESFARVLYRGKEAQSQLRALELARHDQDLVLADLRTQILDKEALADELSQANYVLEVKESVIGDLNGKIAQLTSDGKATLLELEHSEGALKELTGQLAQVVQDNENAKSLLQEKVDELAQVKSELLQRSAEATDLYREIQVLLGEQARVEGLERTLEELRNEVNAKTAIVEGLRNHVGLLMEDVDRSNGELQAALHLNTQMSQAKAQIQNQVDNLVRGLATEKHVYFQRKSTKIRRAADLLVRSGVINPAQYLSDHKDVAEAGVDPAVHYLMHGLNEQRSET